MTALVWKPVRKRICILIFGIILRKEEIKDDILTCFVKMKDLQGNLKAKQECLSDYLLRFYIPLEGNPMNPFLEKYIKKQYLDQDGHPSSVAALL